MGTDVKIDHSARGHALLSASGASKWMNCTPSMRLEKGFEGTTSAAAEEGTLAHEFAELNLKVQLNIITQEEYNKATTPLKDSEYYSTEMEEYVQIHVDYVMERYQKALNVTKDAELLIEEKLDFSHYVKDGYGTSDNTIVCDRLVEVIDFKYGQGLEVLAKNNPQMMLYALGALPNAELMFDIKTVRMTIVQPRLNNISSWEISVEDLIKWAEKEVAPKAEKAFKGSGDQCVGDWCRYCKAKPKCRAHMEQALEIAKQEFGTVREDLMLVDDEELMEVYKKFPSVLNWIKTVQSFVHAEAIKGKSWPEHKLVEGRSKRVWKDKKAVIDRLEEKGFLSDEYMSVPDVLGITAIEKLVGKANFRSEIGDLCDKPQGKPTFVHETDPRPEFFKQSALNEFKDL